MMPMPSESMPCVIDCINAVGAEVRRLETYIVVVVVDVVVVDDDDDDDDDDEVVVVVVEDIADKL